MNELDLIKANDIYIFGVSLYLIKALTNSSTLYRL